MGIKCPKCGGRMTYDIKDKLLKCEYCNSSLTIDEYRTDNEADHQSDTYEMNVYTCRNCGAELVAPDEQTVAYCPYCGGESILGKKEEGQERPKDIIPFNITKQQAAERYGKTLSKKLYVPKQFKDPSFLMEFRGIYLPFRTFEVNIPEGELNLKGSREYTSGGYDYEETYDVDANIGGTVDGYTSDASAAFDDTIAQDIEPYNSNGFDEFNEAYLAGFYSDKVTAPTDIYKAEAVRMASDDIYNEISNKASPVDVSMTDDEKTRIEKIGADTESQKVSLMPVWFLTWRKDDRVAYSVMNGQTGKLHADIPVDRKKFFIVSAVIAAAMFVILSLLPMFILPKNVASIAVVLMIISGFVLKSELKKIRIKEQHIYDYGSNDGKKKKEKKVRPARKFNFFGIIAVVMTLIVVTAFIGMTQGDSEMDLENSLIIPVMLVALVLQIIITVSTITQIKGNERKTALISTIFDLIAAIGGFAVMMMMPSHDAWYYGIAVACLGGLVPNCLSLINYFKYLTTRPVPNFYSREGADNAKGK